ncbi:GTPase [Chloroflexota bacterium]
MPANLPPQYFDAEKRFRMAKSPEGKIDALQAMLAIMPKHKGTDKLHADLRRKIAKISEEADRRSATSKISHYIRKEGAGQVVLIGNPNVGKSQLLAAVTDALPDIADYPFTTKSPIIGMMKFENIQIQIVDTPSLTIRDSRIWLNNIARNADLIAAIVDLSIETVQQMENILSEIGAMGIVHPGINQQDLTTYTPKKKILMIGNKNDLDISAANSEEFNQRYGTKFTVISVSAKYNSNLEELKSKIFQELDIIRVHTKHPGKQVDLSDPMIMKKGDTMKDAAEAVHKDFRQKLKYALVWGSGKFDGQRVSQDHILQDNDVIELHM